MYNLRIVSNDVYVVLLVSFTRFSRTINSSLNLYITELWHLQTADWFASDPNSVVVFFKQAQHDMFRINVV